VQLETKLNAYRIRFNDMKYNAIIRHLDEATMIIVADVLENPPENNNASRKHSSSDSRTLRKSK